MRYPFVGAGALVLERVKAFLGEPEELGLADLQVVGLDDGVVDFLGEELETDVLPEGRVVARGRSSPCRHRLDHALAFELGVGLGDGVAVDAQLLGERPDARQRLAGAHAPRPRRPSPGRRAAGRPACRT